MLQAAVPAVNDPVVVITAGQLQLFKIGIDFQTYLFRLGKVHRGACYRCNLSRRNQLFVYRCIVRSLQPEFMAGVICTSLSHQIKIAVIGGIDHSLLIADCMIMNLQIIIFSQGIGNSKFLVSRESHGTLLVLQCESNAVLRIFCCPHSLVVSIFPVAVQIVGAVVGIQLKSFTIDGKACIIDTVGIGTNGSSEEIRIYKILFQSIKSLYYISDFSVCIRY